MVSRIPYHRRIPRRFTYINQWVKYSLFITNFLFLITGSIFLVCGVLAFIESGGISNITVSSPLKWISNLIVLCIGLGIITLLLSLAGFVGSLRERRGLLKCYYILLTLLFLVEVVCAVLLFVYREQIIVQVEHLIRITFVSQYREIGYEDTTNFVDFVQKEFQCCGPKTYTDWTINRYFVCNETSSREQACGVPHSCCRRMNNINKNIINIYCGFGVQKLSSLMAARDVWTTGCVQAIVSFIEANVIPVAAIISSVAVVQLIEILLAKTLHTQIGDQIRLLMQESEGCY